MIILKQEPDFKHWMGAERISESHIGIAAQERWNQDAKGNRAYSAGGLDKKKTLQQQFGE